MIIIKGSGINIQKNRKRYSKLEDLEHPFTHYLITNFFKDKEFENYKKILYDTFEIDRRIY
jgi:hypothetical protein